ncbi:hypothetical protein HK101_003808 [Irineochytrium annulatum]|nr:hypothetical protein HK101_003808 [Irineochytrium annulatum]
MPALRRQYASELKKCPIYVGKSIEETPAELKPGAIAAIDAAVQKLESCAKAEAVNGVEKLMEELGSEISGIGKDLVMYIYAALRYCNSYGNSKLCDIN